MKAPPRAQVVKNLKNGIIINLLGMGATLLGLQATVGVLVAKALTSSGTPYLQGAPQGYSPVLALDVFLVQVSISRHIILPVSYSLAPYLLFHSWCDLPIFCVENCFNWFSKDGIYLN
jgi:hypothetical protein